MWHVIEWDLEVDGEIVTDHNLPCAVLDMADDTLADRLSDEHGFCVKSITPVEFDMDGFIDGYITALLWADCVNVCEPCEGTGNADRDIDGDRTTCEECDGGSRESGDGHVLELRPGVRGELVRLAQLVEFVEHNMVDLLAYKVACLDGTRVGYTYSEGSPESFAGHDMYLSRAGHGTGFWDRGLGDLGKRLDDAADVLSADGHMLFNHNDGTVSL